MTPDEIYRIACEYIGGEKTVICNLHSACSPEEGKPYLCKTANSRTPVIDFDSVKTKADKEKGIESRKSVDALSCSASGKYICFIELKSWELFLTYNGKESKVRKQTEKYKSDLPEKLKDSIEICKEISGNEDIFEGCVIVFILVTDITPERDGLSSFYSSMSALAGSSSDLRLLCDRLSEGIMKGIPSVETRYWHCRDFDRKINGL